MLKPHIILSFADCLLCLFLVFAALFFASKLEAESKGNVTDPSIFLASIEWSKDSKADVDLFLLSPDGVVLNYLRKENEIAILDVDDKGDKEVDVLRREVASVKRLVSGRYVVNVLAYKLHGETVNVKAQVLKLQGFSVVCEASIELSADGQERTICSFDVDERGQVVYVDRESQTSLVKG